MFNFSNGTHHSIESIAHKTKIASLDINNNQLGFYLVQHYVFIGEKNISMRIPGEVHTILLGIVSKTE